MNIEATIKDCSMMKTESPLCAARVARGGLASVLTALLLSSALPVAQAQTNVGVSISVAQPGGYGRIDIGNYPAPAVIYPQPMVIVPTPVAVVQRPIYLYVPPGHQKRWSKYCAHYAACGQPVYFVQESWVRERYAGGRHDHDDDHDHDRGHGKSKHKGKHKHD
jgi:hypothetical protein